MIEIILVVLILSILIFSFRNMFQIKNKDVAYGQTCVESLYGEIRNFVDAAKRSKGLNSWNVLVYPDQYNIFITPTTNTIQLQYIVNSLPYIYATRTLTGNTSAQRYCNTSSYDMVLSGNDMTVYINKWLAANAQFQWFILSGAGGFTGLINILQCPTNQPICKQLWQLSIDTRTQVIQKKLCLNINTGWLCDEWDK